MHYARHFWILLLILIENIQVRQISSHFSQMAAVKCLFKGTLSRVGSLTQASLTPLAHMLLLTIHVEAILLR